MLLIAMEVSVRKKEIHALSHDEGKQAARAITTQDCRQKKMSKTMKTTYTLRWVKEPHDGFHLCPGEHLGILLVAYVLHRLPHAARVVHLAAEEAQGRVVAMVGVVHLSQLPEGIIPYLESCHDENYDL